MSIISHVLFFIIFRTFINWLNIWLFSLILLFFSVDNIVLLHCKLSCLYMWNYIETIILAWWFIIRTHLYCPIIGSLFHVLQYRYWCSKIWVWFLGWWTIIHFSDLSHIISRGLIILFSCHLLFIYLIFIRIYRIYSVKIIKMVFYLDLSLLLIIYWYSGRSLCCTISAHF